MSRPLRADGHQFRLTTPRRSGTVPTASSTATDGNHIPIREVVWGLLDVRDRLCPWTNLQDRHSEVTARCVDGVAAGQVREGLSEFSRCGAVFRFGEALQNRG
jgi:hypothetical protein